MQHLGFATPLILAVAAVLVSGDIPSNAPNCNLQSPPPNSGEIQGETSALDLKVFPRRKDLQARYTGCQTSWIKSEGGWQRYSIAYLVRGKPVLLLAWPPADLGEDHLQCRYHDKKVVSGNEQDCPEVSEVVLPSMPAGCLQRLRSRKHPEPTECLDEE